MQQFFHLLCTPVSLLEELVLFPGVLQCSIFFGIVGSIDKMDLLCTVGFLPAFDLVAINGAKKRTSDTRFLEQSLDATELIFINEFFKE